MAFIIGLTGGIGCGKSTVSDYLRSKNLIVIDADVIAHQITAPNMEAVAQIAATFGATLINADGALDRQQLAAIVFSDEAALAKLNQITHPLIEKKIEQIIDAKFQERLLILDIPLLFETKTYLSKIDQSWLVIANERQQIERIMKRDHLSETQIRARINNQMATTEKMKLADKIIDNSQSIKITYDQVDKLLKEILF